MLNRRSFLKQTAKASAGGLLLPNLPLSLLAANVPAPGLQLFTFFSVIDNDVRGTLLNIADAGYKNIESAFSRKGGFYGMKAIEFNTMLKDMGMTWRSHHVVGAPFRLPANSAPPKGPDGKPIIIPPMRNLRDHYQQVVDELAEAGVPYLVCASTPIGTLQEIKDSIAILNKTAAAASKAGVGFAYHNHEREFATIDGVVPYELFLSETDPTTMKMELDVAWAIKGGADPVALFRKHPGRFPLWHVKDLDAEYKKVLPVGDGIINYAPVFAAASTAGLQYYFIEHDMPADALQSIRKSLQTVRTLTSA